MWLLRRSPRRLAVRADAAGAETTIRAKRRPAGPAVLIALLGFLLATAIVYYRGEPLPYHINEIAASDLRSPVAFTAADSAEVRNLREAARAHARAVLSPETPAFDLLESQLLNLPQDVRGYATLEALPAEVQQRWPGLTARGLDLLHRIEPAAYAASVRALLNRLERMPLVAPESAAQVASRNAYEVEIRPRTPAASTAPDLAPATMLRTAVTLLQTNDPAKRQALRRLVAGPMPQDLVDPVLSYLLNFDQPTYRFDPHLTAQAADRAAAAVQTEGLRVGVNDILVRKGEVITPALYARLVQAQRRYENELARVHPWAFLFSRLGQALSVLLITLIATLYVTQLNRTVNTLTRGWALAGLLLVTLALAKLTVLAGLHDGTYLVGIAPTLLAAILLTIAYNQRFALIMGALHGLLVTLALGQGVEFFLTLLTGVAIFCFGLRDVRTRGKLIELGVYASAGLFLAVWALGMARFAGSVWDPRTFLLTDLDPALLNLAHHSLWAAAAGMAAGLITLGLLSFPWIESVFQITTSMTLLELADLNHPLLRRLATEAPGTFNHCLVLGTLAEAAGSAVGANGLLCRVGAYYHDIGKLSKPPYFIENKALGGGNRHEKLSPAMSLLIIVGHVKDGIELAREYHLPRVVSQFIAEHHGTTLVEYFYHAARERQAREGEDSAAVSETEFRYPGPKPQTRETAILMICDGVEGAVRSLPEPTPGRIEATVHQLVMKRLMDGQFSECDLTLRDLSQIEQSLTHALTGVYHGRVAYPKAPISQSA